MQQEVEKHENLFQFIPTVAKGNLKSHTVTIGRYLIGRSETCDIIVPVKGVSAIHAVLEVTHNGIKIYDMNSKNGTYVEGNKVVSKKIELNGRVAFGNVEFILKKYSATPDLPPVLPSLEPVSGNASVLKTNLVKETSSRKELPKAPQSDIPYIVYPLSADPDSAYSEYIFEDEKDLYPIFKYKVDKQTVEVIILHKDRVFSVDYLPEHDGVYKIAGSTSKKAEVEFPYLGVNEAIPFIEINKGNCVVSKIHNYEILHLHDEEVKNIKQKNVNLQGDAIVKLTSGDLDIYVRKVSSPPVVKTPPVFGRDKDLRKYVVLMFLLVLLPVIGLNLYEVDEDVKDEKDPERIATILYKQKLTINKNKADASTKKKPIKKQTAPKKKVVKKQAPKKSKASQQKSVKKVAKPTPNPGAKKAPKVQKVKVAKNPAPKRKTVKPIKSAKSGAKSVKKAQTRKANITSSKKGNVDTFKSFDFKSSVNSLLAKGGSIKGAKTAKTGSSSLSNTQVGGGVASNVKSASVSTEVGSLVGSTEGKLAETKGAGGLSTKSGVYTAGIPSETVVLGSMDPDIIRKILRDNIPFFRSCYQKELNRNAGSNIDGTIKLVFSIGASGHVTRAGVTGQTKLPVPVRSCVVGVLRGIKFPRPLGGGTVDVRQPFNFFAKKL